MTNPQVMRQYADILTESGGEGINDEWFKQGAF